ncbi:helix-turn-helix transcriptional regulator [Streptosporangium sp. DT93]|uniref:helix-turn-helix transcriptional regulator n=1 Tax=Streptosporangium sp. DT93 TaxID=3393428 RepID=UPI003CF567E4
MADRQGDRLLNLPEVAELTRRTENQLRWLRHKGECSALFKTGGRLFAWESDVVSWLEDERAADAVNSSLAL